MLDEFWIALSIFAAPLTDNWLCVLFVPLSRATARTSTPLSFPKLINFRPS